MRFRVSKAAVVFNYLWAVWRKHQPEIQAAAECTAFRVHGAHGWQEDRFHAYARDIVRIVRIRSHCAHSARVQPLIVIVRPFMVH